MPPTEKVGRLLGLIIIPPTATYLISKGIDRWEKQSNTNDSSPRNTTLRRSPATRTIGIRSPECFFKLQQTRTNHWVTANEFLIDKKHWTLLYFGFSHCAEVCPKTMQYVCRLLRHFSSQNEKNTLDEVNKEPFIHVDQAGKQSVVSDNKVTTLSLLRSAFVSIDPVRDTAGKIQEFIERFCDTEKNLVDGYVGNMENIQKLASIWRVYVSAPDSEDDNQGPAYQIDHSSFIYLVSPTGQFVDFFAEGLPEEMAIERIKMHMMNAYDI